jgi:hypothetical protein
MEKACRTSTHKKATQFVKNSCESRTFAYIFQYRGEGRSNPLQCRYLLTINYANCTVEWQDSRPFWTGQNIKKYRFTVCCRKSDDLQFINLLSANKVVMFSRPFLFCLLNCVTGTAQVPEGRMLVSPVIEYAYTNARNVFWHTWVRRLIWSVWKWAISLS